MNKTNFNRKNFNKNIFNILTKTFKKSFYKNLNYKSFDNKKFNLFQNNKNILNVKKYFTIHTIGDEIDESIARSRFAYYQNGLDKKKYSESAFQYDDLTLQHNHFVDFIRINKNKKFDDNNGKYFSWFEIRDAFLFGLLTPTITILIASMMEKNINMVFFVSTFSFAPIIYFIFKIQQGYIFLTYDEYSYLEYKNKDFKKECEKKTYKI